MTFGETVTLKRKIAAIMAADIAQYSRLIAEDEEETLTRLAAYRQVFDDFVARSGGRIFNTAGDAVMCEFQSAVEAVRCAVDIQESLRTRNRAFPHSRQMHFRIGITIGDVVERDGDLLGDGVNIAARLESLAEPGGICVSRNVHEAVANKISLPFRDLGEREVKNIPHPVRAYTIDIQSPKSGLRVEPAMAVEPRKAAAMAARRSRGWLVPVLSLGVSLAAIGVAWHALMRPPLPPPGHDMPDRPPPPPGRPPGATGSGGPPPPLPRPQEQASVVVTEGLSPAEAFAKLAQSGGLVREPKSAPELYHNARSHEARGESAPARRDYLALARLKGDHIDPLMRFAALLRAQDGRAGAREVFSDLADASTAARIVHALQFEGADRLTRLAALAEANPDYAPVHYLLAEEYGEDRRGSQTIEDRRRERASLRKFLEAERDGKLNPYFLDLSVLSQWVDRATKRVAALDTALDGAKTTPNLTFTRHNTGWSVTIQVPEATQEILYRIGDQGDFRASGHLQMVDQRTGKPFANPTFDMPGGQKATTIYVRYRDSNGVLTEPVGYTFEPMDQLVRSQRQMLEHSKSGWLQFGRDHNAQYLYYTTLMSMRCAIAEAKIGYNTSEPITVLAMPPCDPANPHAIPSGAMPYLRIGPGIKSVQLVVTFTDGFRTEEMTFER